MATVTVAQPSGQIPEVKVSADKPVATWGRTPEGRPVESVQLSHAVTFADLDLTTPSGAAALRKRVSDAADLVCKEIDKLYGIQLEPRVTQGRRVGACVDDAVKTAEPQVRAAITAAESIRSAQK